MTLKAAVIGNPIAQSKSPRMHNHWLKTLGIDGEYEAKLASLDGFEACVRALMAEGYQGANVTIPFKEQALAIADEATPLARSIGAANTLIFHEGGILADNTDGYGFGANILSEIPDWIVGDSHIVLGAGGAARAIVAWLLAFRAREIILVNRNIERADEIAKMSDKIKVQAWNALENNLHGKASLINTTSLGMNGKGDIAIDFTGADPKMIVNDIVYNPIETGLLRDAKLAGLRTVDGLGMLLWQARPGFASWFGQEPPAIDDELRELMLK